MSARSAGRPAQKPATPGRPGLLVALAVVFSLEALGLAAVLLLLVLQIVGARRGVDLASAAALGVLTALGVVLLVLLARGALRSQAWIRAAGIVWQLVQLLVAVAAFQGAGAQPALGVLVGVPALVGLVLLFAPSVREALRRPDADR